MVLIAAIGLFWQCGHKSELQTKNSAGQEIVLNEISNELLHSLIDSIDFIPLETTHKSLIRSVAQLDIMDDYLYILNDDFASVLIYNRQGKLVNSIHNQGRGPQEYIRINGMYLDHLNHRIILSDTFSKRLLIYDSLGTFVSVIPLEICQGHIVPFLQNHFVHINEGIEDMLPKKMQNYNLTILNENGQIEHSILPDQTPNPLYIDTRNNVQCLDNGEIVFSPLQSGEIYQIGADSIILKYYFTSALKGYKMMQPADLKKIRYKVEDTESIWDRFEKRGYLCFTGTYLEDPTWLFSTIGLHEYRYFVFYNKNTGQSTIIDCTTRSD